MNKPPGCKELYLLRHGDTGLTGSYIGSTDVELSEEGMAQVARTGKALQQQFFDQVLCSPMVRCRKTVELIDVRADVRELEILKEIDFGRWERKDFAAIVTQDPSLVEKWLAAPESFIFPGGESVEEFRQRVAEVTALLYSTDFSRILIVSHGGVIRHLLCSLLHLDAVNYLLFDIQPGCYSTLDLYPEGGVLTALNLKA